MLENLTKPVILTGSQLPIGLIRTDGRENLLAALEIATCRINEKPVVTEVCIYFENKLFRGNRTHKSSAEDFHAFESVNYPPLAEVGVHVKFNDEFIQPASSGSLQVHAELDTRIAILKLFPGINIETIRPILESVTIRAIILETYGSGNASTNPEFLKLLKKGIESGKLIYNVTQCRGGAVDPDKYQTGRALRDIGVIPGFDITPEAAVTKLMFILGKPFSEKERKEMLIHSLRGEMTS
jgi:L-asparaginase